MPDALAALRQRLATLHDLSSAAAVLDWDQETYLPPAAHDARSEQVATLRRLAHAHLVSDETEAAVADAEALMPDLEARGDDESLFAVGLVREARRDLDRARKLSEDFVAREARTVGRAKEAWRAARQASDFAQFAPHLARIVDLNREHSDLIGYADHPYDALLDQFEPGATTAGVQRVFSDLRERLVPIVQTLSSREQPGDGAARGHFPHDAQWAFGMDVLRAVGFDLTRGRQDVSAHPFTTTFDRTDVRITTRVDEGFFPTAFFSTLHEAGHGLYEQGVDPMTARTLLAEGTSLGMHESQSRLWENQVARSRPFWEHWWPRAQEAFPDALAGRSLDAFHAALTHVAPSPIRVEADEVTYNLHIMLRMELEVGLIEGSIQVDELPERWNDAMERYLGIRPASDAQGVLQDVHWALGTIGYFPTYALGTLMSAQLFDACDRDIAPTHGSLHEQFARGEFGPLLEWMRAHVHRWGRAKSADRILRDATGGPLSADPWLAYIGRTYGV
jgi:carboxypeptidase Taq